MREPHVPSQSCRASRLLMVNAKMLLSMRKSWRACQTPMQVKTLIRESANMPCIRGHALILAVVV